MRAPPAPTALLTLLALAAPPPAARAEPVLPPPCGEAADGAVACLAGQLCRCGFARGGEMTGRPDRWRWDCGLLRPACPAPGGADLGRIDGPLPAVVIDADRPRRRPGPRRPPHHD